MQKLKLSLVVILMLIATDLNAQKDLDKIIVDQDWMQKHLDDKNLVILQVTGAKEFEEGHIQGSQLINPPEYTQVVGDLYWEIPEIDSLDKALRSKGISNKSKIVLVHGGNGHAVTFRLYFTLDYFGLSKNTVILDGGLKGWKFKNLPVTTEAMVNEVVPEGNLRLKPNPSIKVDKDYVRANVGKGKTNVIDARRPNYYAGDEKGNYTRGGHVAGAGNVCWLDIVDENLFMKDTNTLRALYESQGVNKKDEVVAYCHVGLRASVIYTVAKGLGYKAKLYDGSYNEWDGLGEEYPSKDGRDK